MSGTAQRRSGCRRSRLPAAATRATRTSPARNSARSVSIRPPRSLLSSAAPRGPISRARYERSPLCLAAADRSGHGAAGPRARRPHLLRDAQGIDRGGHSRTHAREPRVGVVLRRLRRCRGRSRRHRRSHRARRMVVAQRAQRRRPGERFRSPAARPRPARRRSGGAAVTARGLRHRSSVLWIAALVHRLSGLALAIFLPVHFLTLGLAIEGETSLENFLHWSDQPLVKLAESGLVFVLMVHMLGGVRVLLIENLDWHDRQKELATVAAAVSAIVGFILLARML